MANAYAVVIGIENYQQSAISGIGYAHDDANAMASVFEECFGVSKENIKVWLDNDASFARMASELKYDTQNLGPDDQFYFFYAGHGFWSPEGGNRLTAWDTHPSNTSETTISVEDVLLTPLKKARCKTSALFIDACATALKAKGASRDLLTDMSKDEFVAFSKGAQFLTTFFACSPEEKSYSSSVVKHGIWTYHLVRALRGEEPGAIYKDAFITLTSLQDYLRAAVRKFVREKMKISALQTPYAIFQHDGTAPLVALPEPPVPSGEPLLEPDFSGAYFFGIETRDYKSLPGFNRKSHTVPAYHSERAESFARQLLSSEVSAELQTIIQNAREVLKVKYKDLKKSDDEDGAGTVDADAFRFEIEVGQSKSDHTEAFVRREVRLREKYAKLPDDFDSIFPEGVDTLVIPLRNTENRFIELRDAIEDRDADLEADETAETLKFELKNGLRVKLDMKRGRMVVKKPGVAGALSLIETFAESGGPQIAGPTPKLIGKDRADE